MRSGSPGDPGGLCSDASPQEAGREPPGQDAPFAGAEGLALGDGVTAVGGDV